MPFAPNSRFRTESEANGTHPASSINEPSVGTALTPPLLNPSDTVAYQVWFSFGI